MPNATKRGGRRRPHGETCAFCSEVKTASIAGYPLGDRCIAKVREIAEDAGVDARLDDPSVRFVHPPIDLIDEEIDTEVELAASGATVDETIEARCRCGSALAPWSGRGRKPKHCSKKCTQKAAHAAFAERRRPAAAAVIDEPTAAVENTQAVEATLPTDAPVRRCRCGAPIPPSTSTRGGRPRLHCSRKCGIAASFNKKARPAPSLGDPEPIAADTSLEEYVNSEAVCLAVQSLIAGDDESELVTAGGDHLNGRSEYWAGGLEL